MKRTTIHVYAAFALLASLAACTQDEAGSMLEGVEGTPVIFTATGLNIATGTTVARATPGTRAPVDGNWQGVQSVAVMIDGKVKAYNVAPSTVDNTCATLTSDDPHYWTNHNDITVVAWWPYTAGETTPPAVVVREDQSTQADFEGSDFISSENQPVTYGNPTLHFTHRTALVHIALTDNPEGLVSVRLTSLSTKGGNPTEIIPYKKGGYTYTAFVAPQTVAAGTPFIVCTFNSGKTFAYRMQNAAEWKAGETYTYTIFLENTDDRGYTITTDGDGKTIYNVYSADGLMEWNRVAQINPTLGCTLTKDIDITGREWTPVGTDEFHQYYGTFDGGNHTITGLTVNLPNQINTGMFGFLGRGGMVKHLTLKDVDITGRDNAGGVVGCNISKLIECQVDGIVTSTGSSGKAGGVVGNNIGDIIDCYATGFVNATDFGVAGGVVGINGGDITGCHATSIVTGNSGAGGVVGYSSGTVCGCHAMGSITSGGGSAGGVVEINFGGVMGCYATCDVHSTGGDIGEICGAGGVVGFHRTDFIYASITACYHATGTVTFTGITDFGLGGAGGVVGVTTGIVFTACYWSNNVEVDIGSRVGEYAQFTGEATKVNGTTVT